MFNYMMQNFTDPRQLEPKRIKAIHVQWAKCLLRVRNEVLGV